MVVWWWGGGGGGVEVVVVVEPPLTGTADTLTWRTRDVDSL